MATNGDTDDRVSNHSGRDSNHDDNANDDEGVALGQRQETDASLHNEKSLGGLLHSGTDIRKHHADGDEDPDAAAAILRSWIGNAG